MLNPEFTAIKIITHIDANPLYIQFFFSMKQISSQNFHLINNRRTLLSTLPSKNEARWNWIQIWARIESRDGVRRLSFTNVDERHRLNWTRVCVNIVY